MQIPTGKKVYFLSDFHLGVPDREASLQRERKIVRFLEAARYDAACIFILGDMFDFWYEYRRTVPKGYVRLLGKIAEISDSGIPFHFFVGNHDMWMSGYFEAELGMPVYFEPRVFQFNDKKFMIGHGDGLGPGDHGYKFLKKVFRNPFCQALFGLIPPSIGIGIADYFSRSSRAATGTKEDRFLGEDREWLVIHSRDVLKQQHYDYFIFGHRHLPIDLPLSAKSRYLNLGDWIRHFSYAEFDGNDLVMKFFEP